MNTPGFYVVQVNFDGSKTVIAFTVDSTNTSFDPNNYQTQDATSGAPVFPAIPLRGFNDLTSSPNITQFPAGMSVVFE